MDSEWVPESVDLSKPSAARMYDYYLGGGHNFAVDREAAEKAIAAMPFTTTGARTNRAWLRRAVTYLCGAGMRQFLDLGSGVPTVGNVHEIAQTAAPEAKVVYVDVDPVAYEHARLLLADNDNASSVRADMRDVDRVLTASAELLDLDQPVAVLMSAVLHFVPDSDRPAEIVAGYRDALVPGSYIALSHMSPIGRPAEELERFQAVYKGAANPVSLRDRAAIEPLLAGLELVEPGLVKVPLWHPEDPPKPEHEDFPGYGVVGRKP
ncbi:S-adenosyl methyltransferase [Herbihabitans rhizosphaerae]|uniref:S-adenosyl methyltransferase n=1 Tax=Herbihabitans rhizosphaerae TaxID=1872711 RepID=A0A4Q7KD90_9PSEU|nr:SAM-dependent methyltransferase [Herbihabitans rhizosphaerae]RZS30319.1 S-adenosyl methyltransferase [Herbihabitans rhizosphaerae]